MEHSHTSHEPPKLVLPIEDEEAEAIGLVEAQDEQAPPSKKIKAFGVLAGHKSHEWKRPTHANGTGAVRVRTFHGKLSDQGMMYIDDAINQWLDQHPEIEVKFVTSSIGTFDGKIREPALILNVWY